MNMKTEDMIRAVVDAVDLRIESIPELMEPHEVKELLISTTCDVLDRIESCIKETPFDQSDERRSDSYSSQFSRYFDNINT